MRRSWLRPACLGLGLGVALAVTSAPYVTFANPASSSPAPDPQASRVLNDAIRRNLARNTSRRARTARLVRALRRSSGHGPKSHGVVGERQARQAIATVDDPDHRTALGRQLEFDLARRTPPRSTLRRLRHAHGRNLTLRHAARSFAKDTTNPKLVRSVRDAHERGETPGADVARTETSGPTGDHDVDQLFENTAITDWAIRVGLGIESGLEVLHNREIGNALACTVHYNPGPEAEANAARGSTVQAKLLRRMRRAVQRLRAAGDEPRTDEPLALPGYNNAAAFGDGPGTDQIVVGSGSLPFRTGGFTALEVVAHEWWHRFRAVALAGHETDYDGEGWTGGYDEYASDLGGMLTVHLDLESRGALPERLGDVDWGFARIWPDGVMDVNGEHAGTLRNLARPGEAYDGDEQIGTFADGAALPPELQDPHIKSGPFSRVLALAATRVDDARVNGDRWMRTLGPVLLHAQTKVGRKTTPDKVYSAQVASAREVWAHKPEVASAIEAALHEAWAIVKGGEVAAERSGLGDRIRDRVGRWLPRRVAN